MNDSESSSTSPILPVARRRADETERLEFGEQDVMERVSIDRDTGPDGTPVVTAMEQAKHHAEIHIGRGASVFHLGSSSLGINLNLTDAGRAEVLAELDNALEAVKQKYASAKP